MHKCHRNQFILHKNVVNKREKNPIFRRGAYGWNSTKHYIYQYLPEKLSKWNSKNKCWIVSKLLQKQRYLLPCQFLLDRLSFVSHLILRNHIKILFFNDTFVLQVSCVTLIKLLTRNIYVIIMLLLQQIVRQKRFLITDYRVANGIVVHLLLPRGGPNPWMKMTLSSYKGQ